MRSAAHYGDEMKIASFLRFFRFSPSSSAEILRELLADLRDLGRSDKYIGTIRLDVGKFVARFPRLEKVTAGDVAAYLRGISETVSQRRRDNIRNSIVTLFRFARDRDYLPEERRTAAEKIRQIKPSHDIVTFSPGEVRVLLDYIPLSPIRGPNPKIDWLPCEVIGLFAGLRRKARYSIDPFSESD